MGYIRAEEMDGDVCDAMVHRMCYCAVKWVQ